MNKTLKTYANKVIVSQETNNTLLLNEFNSLDKEHVELLKNFGWDEELKKDQQKINIAAEIMESKKKYNDILTYKELSKIAIKMGYVIIKYNDYKGPVSKELSSNIIELLASKDLNVKQTSALDRLYLMCPFKYTLDTANRKDKNPDNVVCLYDETSNDLHNVDNYQEYRTMSIHGEIGKSNIFKLTSNLLYKFILNNARFFNFIEYTKSYLFIFAIIAVVFNIGMYFIDITQKNSILFAGLIITVFIVCNLLSIIALFITDFNKDCTGLTERYEEYDDITMTNKGSNSLGLQYYTNFVINKMHIKIPLWKMKLNQLALRLIVLIIINIAYVNVLLIPYKTYNHDKIIVDDKQYFKIDGHTFYTIHLNKIN